MHVTVVRHKKAKCCGRCMYFNEHTKRCDKLNVDTISNTSGCNYFMTWYNHNKTVKAMEKAEYERKVRLLAGGKSTECKK